MNFTQILARRVYLNIITKKIFSAGNTTVTLKKGNQLKGVIAFLPTARWEDKYLTKEKEKKKPFIRFWWRFYLNGIKFRCFIKSHQFKKMRASLSEKY